MKYKGCSKSDVSYFMALTMMSEVDFGGMAVEVESSCQ